MSKVSGKSEFSCRIKIILSIKLINTAWQGKEGGGGDTASLPVAVRKVLGLTPGLIFFSHLSMIVTN